MNPNQSNELADKLKGLFPKMTDRQTLECAGKLDSFPFEPAQRAIARLSEVNEDFSLPRLLFFLREEKAKTKGNEPKCVRLIDTLRQHAMELFPAKAGAISRQCDSEVALRVARGWWISGLGPDGQPRFNGEARKSKIAADLIAILVTDCGMTAEEAPRWVEFVFGEARWFDQAIDELNGVAIPQF
jgi:hypothetical protein